MHAHQIQFLELLNGQVQYVVPRWQRRYSWGQREIERAERRGLLRGGGHRQERVLALAAASGGRGRGGRRRRNGIRRAVRGAAGVVGRGTGARRRRGAAGASAGVLIPAAERRIWLCVAPTDMRRSFDGLAALGAQPPGRGSSGRILVRTTYGSARTSCAQRRGARRRRGGTRALNYMIPPTLSCVPTASPMNGSDFLGIANRRGTLRPQWPTVLP